MRNILLGLSLAFLTAMPAQSVAKDKVTLYDKLGGEKGVHNIVWSMLRQTHSDPRTAEVMENSNIDRNAKLIIEYICAKTDGPCEYTGQEMHIAHHGLGITTAHFNALVENLQKAMRDEGIPFSVQGQLLAHLAPEYRNVVVRSRKGE